MLSLSSAAIVEKNKISGAGAWLVLLEIDAPGYGTIRLSSDNQHTVWPSSGGNLFVSFPFQIDDRRDDASGSLPSFNIRVSNVSRALVPYLESTDGMKGSTVRLLVVHADHLDLTSAELDETFDLLSVSLDDFWVTFVVGAENPMRQRSPRDRYLKDHCRFKFKSARCGYGGAATLCDGTFRRCRALGNSARYGGFPGIDGGVYV